MRLPARSDLAGSPPEGLLVLYANILDELIDQGVVRSTNNPVADYSEYLAARAFGLVLLANANLGYDAIGPEGLRYQVKARRLTIRNSSRQLGFLRGLDALTDPFDVLLGILFDADFTVLRAALIPIATIREHGRRVDYVNGWRFILRDGVWAMPGVVDVTDRIRAAVAAPIAMPPIVREHPVVGASVPSASTERLATEWAEVLRPGSPPAVGVLLARHPDSVARTHRLVDRLTVPRLIAIADALHNKCRVRDMALLAPGDPVRQSDLAWTALEFGATKTHGGPSGWTGAAALLAGRADAGLAAVTALDIAAIARVGARIVSGPYSRSVPRRSG